MGILHQCIYCRRLLDETGFNREHVISEAFGKFENALVLHNTVCRDCNRYFGDLLEVRFTRGAFEGLLRFEKGLRNPPDEVIKLPYVEVTLPAGTTWSGVRLGLRMEDKLRIHLFPQVAFQPKSKSKGAWVHITTYEIEKGALTDTSDLDTRTARIFTLTEAERDAILCMLRENGIGFTRLEDFDAPKGLFDGRDLEVDLTVTVNKGIRRCVAKYVFNYLAHECGSAFVLGADFDPVRRFIRYGEVAGHELVVEDVRPKWGHGSAEGKETTGHVVAIQWATNGLDLIGQVQFFGAIRYTVLLARQYGGPIWRPIRCGSHYDVESRTIRPVFGPLSNG
jgi:hypothetical protein